MGARQRRKTDQEYARNAIDRADGKLREAANTLRANGMGDLADEIMRFVAEALRLAKKQADFDMHHPKGAHYFEHHGEGPARPNSAIRRKA